jgi:O-antigen ligase
MPRRTKKSARVFKPENNFTYSAYDEFSYPSRHKMKRKCILLCMDKVFLLWLLSFPFIMLYGAYEGPKIFWLWGGCFFLTLLWLVRVIQGKQFTLTKTSVLYVLWLGVLTISSVLGVHPASSLVGGSYRHQGVLFFFSLFLIFQTKELLSYTLKKQLDIWIAIPVFVESIIVIVGKTLRFQSRPLGTIGEPNAVAGYLAFGLYWVWNMRKIPTWVRFLLCVLILVAIIATESRTGIVTAIVVLVGSLYQEFGKTITKKHIPILIGSCLIAGCIVCLVSIGTIFLKRPYSSYENRQLFWGLAAKEISTRPLLGFGAESGENVFDAAFASENIRIFDTMVDRSHNIFLDVLMWSGSIGFFVFLFWIYNIGSRFVREKDWRRLTAYIGWLIFAFFQPVGVVHWVGLMLLI